MDKSVRPEIYGVMSIADVESQLRRDKMPAPFIRRMRVINLLSALTLRKIEDNMIAPFEVMDIHHVLNEQISQDAIIAMLENKNLALALETGDLQPLWVESKEKPLLRKGFEQGWMQRFNKTPFDPICVMLAMRAKLMLDAVDELGHSYDLLKSLGMGWIDFGEIPGEEAGDPDSYIPPVVDAPIDYPVPPPDPVPGDPDYVPGPGEPGYIPPADLTPGDPGYTPGPGDPGYVHPWDIVPGEPGHVPDQDSPDYIAPPLRMPGEPGYGGVPGEAIELPPGWDEGLFPGSPDYEPGPGEPGYEYPSSPGGGLYGGDYGPGGSGTPGGPYGGGGDYASTVPPAPLGYGPGWMFSGRGFGSFTYGVGIDCCLDKDNPLEYVHIGYFTSSINAGDTLGLTVEGAHEDCDGGNYEWIEVNGVGSLDAESGLDVIYTAPAAGHNCPGNASIQLICNEEVIDTLEITINYDYAISFTYGDPELEIGQNDSLVVNVSANGTPLTWSVAGTGFSLEHAETAGTGNVLHADGSACGAATITITDCDGNVAIGFVRCTVGQWVFKSNTCGLPGVAGTVYSVSSYSYFKVRAIQGNKKQENKYNKDTVTTERLALPGTHQEVCIDGPSPCAAWIVKNCAGGDSQCLTYTVDCSDAWPPAPIFCSQDGYICRGDCYCYWNGTQYEWYMDFMRYHTPVGGNLEYYEWEC